MDLPTLKKHPWKFEERGNSICQHISSQVIGQPRLAGHWIITARIHQDTGRFEDTGERGNLSPPLYYTFPRLFMISSLREISCLLLWLFIYVHYELFMYAGYLHLNKHSRRTTRPVHYCLYCLTRLWPMQWVPVVSMVLRT